MLGNPYSPSPSKAAAWNEGFSKGLASNSSPQPSDSIGQDDTDAFNDGVSAGMDAQTNGIDLGLSCIAAPDDGGEAVSSWLENGERLGDAYKLLKLPEVGTLVEGVVVSLVLTLITNPIGTQPVGQALPPLQQPLIDSLGNMGLENFQLFCGVGIDPLAEDCELKATPFFLQQQQAADAVAAFGRGVTTIVSWRTDQCGSFTVVE